MSTDEHGRRHNILGSPTELELIHRRLTDILTAAKTLEADELETEESPSDGELKSWLRVTGLAGEDPIMFMADDLRVFYVQVAVHYQDEYGDVTGLGSDSEGRSTGLAQLDPMAELEHRTIDIFFALTQTPNFDAPEDLLTYRNCWTLTYHAGGSIDLSFYMMTDPQSAELRKIPDPSSEDLRALIEILDRADEKFVAAVVDPESQE